MSSGDSPSVASRRFTPAQWVLIVPAGVSLFLAVVTGVFSALAKPLAQVSTPASTNHFHPVPLDEFYQRPFASYKPTEMWARVPRGVTNFDGVPFRMSGPIELTGLGSARDGYFQPARAGEIPLGRKATRLHVIHAASYDDPDDTPMAALWLHYTNGTDRKIFIRYGAHVRNSYPTMETRRPGERSILRDPRSLVIWNGNTRDDDSGYPLRLFKSTFENPQPTNEIRSIELLSLFSCTSSGILAITLEEPATPNPAAIQSIEETDDFELRRELLVRTLDAATGRGVSNVMVNLSVTEDGRMYGFGTYRSDRHGQILLDYPPGKFRNLQFKANHSDFLPFMFTAASGQGIFGPEIPVRLKRRPAAAPGAP